jgi:hypothetical protein
MRVQASAEREVKKYLSCLGDNPIVRPLGEGGEMPGNTIQEKSLEILSEKKYEEEA